MTGDEVRIPVAAVSRHAGAVDAGADDVDVGRSAATHVQLGAEAYGRICGFLPGLIEPVAEATIRAMAESATALRETAANLRTAAARADSSDHAAAARVTQAGRHLELPL